MIKIKATQLSLIHTKEANLAVINDVRPLIKNKLSNSGVSEANEAKSSRPATDFNRHISARDFTKPLEIGLQRLLRHRARHPADEKLPRIRHGGSRRRRRLRHCSHRNLGFRIGLEKLRIWGFWGGIYGAREEEGFKRV